MNYRKKIYLSLVIFLFAGILSAQSQKIDKSLFSVLQKLPISSEKKIVAKNQTLSFDIRLIKCKKEWILLSSDSANVFAMLYDTKSHTSQAASKFLTEGIIRALQHGTLKVKKKMKKVDDIYFDKYFLLKGKGKKRYKILKELDSGSEKEGIVKKLLRIIGLG